MSFSAVAGRIILTLFQNSYKGWKGKFFKVCCTKRDPTALDGFPLYWVKEPRPIEPNSLDELPSADREVCVALAGMGIVFNTAELIAREFDADALSQYFGRNCSRRLTWVVFMRGLSSRARAPSFCSVCEYLKRSEQRGALAAVSTPTIKSASEKHQR